MFGQGFGPALASQIMMNIQLITPAPLRFNNGNRITALRWATILRGLRHKVTVEQRYDGGPCDAMIALHARRSADSIERFHDAHPGSPLIVVLTGTDLYRDIRTDPAAQSSLEAATRLVVLQNMALAELPRRLHAKTRVIYQSAESSNGRPPHLGNGSFKVCVIGHLRPEKDPMRTAMAVRRLPSSSQMQVVHIGRALDDDLKKRALAESARNPRYRWVGEWPHWKTRQALARSHLLALTSRMEGSSNVLSEALASSVPVVASKIRGLIGTLGSDYPGYYTVGKTEELAELLEKTERNSRFYKRLKRHCSGLRPLVDPKREIKAWRDLLREFSK